MTRRIHAHSRVVCWLGTALLAAGCGSHSGSSALTYEQQIAQQREAKDEFFRAGGDSPVPSDLRGALVPLGYFEIQPAYHVAAALKPSTGEPAIEMPTSTGQRRQMRRAGVLEFSLNNQPLHLTAFVEADDQRMARLFVPFADLTNGTETYAAGRYLDLDRTPTGLYDLDFNRAYHPYCYYSPTYDCPYPPAENRLRFPVRAGERMKP